MCAPRIRAARATWWARTANHICGNAGHQHKKKAGASPSKATPALLYVVELRDGRVRDVGRRSRTDWLGPRDFERIQTKGVSPNLSEKRRCLAGPRGGSPRRFWIQRGAAASLIKRHYEQVSGRIFPELRRSFPLRYSSNGGVEAIESPPVDAIQSWATGEFSRMRNHLVEVLTGHARTRTPRLAEPLCAWAIPAVAINLYSVTTYVRVI